MDAGNIIGHHVDFEMIKRFQQFDPRYCTKKFQKLEKRFTTPQDNITIIVTTKPPKTTTVTKVETKTSIVFLHDDDENE